MRGTPGRPRGAPPRLARIFGLDRNPLRRASDRVEAWIRVGLVVIFVSLGPIAALAAGHWAYAAQSAAVNTEVANTHAARAVLLQPTTTSGDLAIGRLGGQVWVLARWERAGTPATTGEVQAPAGLPAGSPVTIWLGNSGNLVGPPDRGGFIEAVAFTTVMTLAFLGLGLLAIMRLVQSMLNRRRLSAWEAAWSAIEPRWTGRR